MPDQINVNNYIWVRLTDAGVAAHNAYWAELSFDIAVEQIEPLTWKRFQLWEFMAIFGSSFSMGLDSPIYNNIISFVDPTLDPDDQCHWCGGKRTSHNGVAYGGNYGYDGHKFVEQP